MIKLTLVLLSLAHARTMQGPCYQMGDHLGYHCTVIQLPDFNFTMPVPALKLPDYNEIIRNAVPNLNLPAAVQGIKTVEDFLKVQQIFALAMPKITDAFYKDLLTKQAELTRSALDQVGKVKIGALSDSALLASMPDLPNSSKLIDEVRKVMAEKKVPFDLDGSASSNEGMRDIYRSLLGEVKNLGIKIILSSEEINQTLSIEGFKQSIEVMTGLDANSLIDQAIVVADVGLSFVPVVGVSRDIYEVATGRSLLTNEALTDDQRVLALVGIVTLGVVSEASHVMQAAAKLGAKEAEIARVITRAERLGVRADTQYAHYAQKEWSVAAKESFPKVLVELNGSEREIELAASKIGIRPEVLAERRAKAIGVYNNHPSFQGNVGEIHDHLLGIDFTKEVGPERLQKGERLFQRNKVGHTGNYFTKEIQPAGKVGAGDLYGSKDGLISRELVEYEVKEPTYALKSTAGEIKDTWSIQKPGLGHFETEPNGVLVEGMQYAPGGGEQLFLDPSKVRRISP